MANVIVGNANILAYEVCIQYGNHNNATAFEVQVLKAKEALWKVQSKFCQTIRAIDTKFDDEEWDKKWLT
jgi:pyruvate/2-oxoacid:ferredoxin oxidoreductase beta subunit